jgi:hypothetical protein
MFDLVRDPSEQNNLLFDAQVAQTPEVAATFTALKRELETLKSRYRDEGQYADPSTWPPGSADGPFDDKQPLGKKSVVEAIARSGGKASK